MKKTEKALLVEDLAARLKDAKSVVVVDYQGLPVKELNSLRAKIQDAGGRLLVVKNTLLKLALQKAKSSRSIQRIGKQKAKLGSQGETLRTYEGLVGPTAVVFAEGDEIAPLQALGRSIQETERPALKFGIFGDATYGAERLLVLSRLPGREALLGQLVGTVAGPQYTLVGTLQGNLQKLVYILSAKAKSTS